MTDIFFTDPDEVPLPPQEVRILLFKVEPNPDGRRVVVHFQLTPFQEKPNIEISIHDTDDIGVAQLNVVEAIENRMDFTVYLRNENTSGEYTAYMRVIYSNLDDFELGDREDVPLETIFAEIEHNVVDTVETSFSIG